MIDRFRKRIINPLLQRCRDQNRIQKKRMRISTRDYRNIQENWMDKIGDRTGIVEVQKYGQHILAIGARVQQGNAPRPNYRGVTKNTNGQRPYVPVSQIYEYRSDQRNGQSKARIVCWSCKEEEDYSRDRANRIITCHIRRDFPIIKYGRYDKNSHNKDYCPGVRSRSRGVKF